MTVAIPNKFLAGWMRGLALAGAAAGSAFLGLSMALVLPIPKALIPHDQGPRSPLDLFNYRVSRPVNILLMGIDRVPTAKVGTSELFSGRSDTMLLMRLDPTNQAVSLLSVPRDTQVTLNSGAIAKINEANVRGGATLAAQTVSRYLNGVPIDRYVRVSTEAFRVLVNELGGVEVNVPRKMVYEDKTQKLKIDLDPGLQTLDGEKAEQFARFRHDDFGDIGRVQRQQILLKALQKRLINPLTFPKIPGLIRTMQQYIDTNLTHEEIIALVNTGRSLSPSDFKMVLLPGRFSSPGEFRASYWLMDEAGRDRVMQQYFKIDPANNADTTTLVTNLRIAVQNASKNPTAAKSLRYHLIEMGFTNVFLAPDWNDQQRQTYIIAQQGDLKSAADLRNALGVGKVAADSTGELESDLTIRVGEDWGKRGKR